MPCIPLLDEPLGDASVIVRDATESDIPEVLIAYDDDPELHLRMGEERPPSAAELGRRAEREPADRAAGRRASLTIREPGSQTCRGQIYVHRVDWQNARAEIGMWLAPQARGRGLAADALTLVCRWLLDACGLERLQILTQPDNEAMLHAARSAGFVYEGILHGYLHERGRRVDVAILSLLTSDLNDPWPTGA